MSPKGPLSSLIIDEDSQDSISESQTSKIHIMECDGNVLTSDLTLDDIQLLVQLFYLPYEHGSNAQQIFIDFHWLRFNSNRHEKV
jgi:hypothetical protein